jgi:hypothetical protein
LISKSAAVFLVVFSTFSDSVPVGPGMRSAALSSAGVILSIKGAILS